MWRFWAVGLLLAATIGVGEFLNLDSQCSWWGVCYGFGRVWSARTVYAQESPTPTPTAEPSLDADILQRLTEIRDDQAALRDEVNRHFGALRGYSPEPTPIVDDHRLMEVDEGLYAATRVLYGLVVVQVVALAVAVVGVVGRWRA